MLAIQPQRSTDLQVETRLRRGLPQPQAGTVPCLPPGNGDVVSDGVNLLTAVPDGFALAGHVLDGAVEAHRVPCERTDASFISHDKIAVDRRHTQTMDSLDIIPSDLPRIFLPAE
jgi:hypothetical protein